MQLNPQMRAPYAKTRRRFCTQCIHSAHVPRMLQQLTLCACPCGWSLRKLCAGSTLQGPKSFGLRCTNVALWRPHGPTTTKAYSSTWSARHAKVRAKTQLDVRGLRAGSRVRATTQTIGKPMQVPARGVEGGGRLVRQCLVMGKVLAAALRYSFVEPPRKRETQSMMNRSMSYSTHAVVIKRARKMEAPHP